MLISICRTIQNVAENIQRTMASGMPQFRAWNKYQVQLVHAAKVSAIHKMSKLDFSFDIGFWWLKWSVRYACVTGCSQTWMYWQVKLFSLKLPVKHCVLFWKAHAEMHVVTTCVKHVGRELDDAIRNVLTRLCQLHALYRIHVNSGDFIKVWWHSEKASIQLGCIQ